MRHPVVTGETLQERHERICREQDELRERIKKVQTTAAERQAIVDDLKRAGLRCKACGEIIRDRQQIRKWECEALRRLRCGDSLELVRSGRVCNMRCFCNYRKQTTDHTEERRKRVEKLRGIIDRLKKKSQKARRELASLLALGSENGEGK